METEMRSSQGDMDLDEWELIPKNCFKDLHLDHGEYDHHGAMMMDCFLSPSTQDPLHKIESPPRSIVVPTKPLQVPIAWEPMLDHEDKKITIDPDLDPDPTQTLLIDSVPSPRVSFKKTKETEFADMKVDPPARITSPVPLLDAAKPSDCDDLRVKKVNDDVTSEHGGEKLNLWKIGLNGIGAVCSFGVAAAAATVCVLFLGHNNIKVCKNKNHKLRFQIYSDDHKRMNEAVKSVPVVRAQISFGGYYDGL